MEMTINEAIRDLVYLKRCGIFPFNYGTDAKQLTIATDECIAVAVDTMRKYQMFQDKYTERLKADMVIMLTEIQLEIREYHEIGCDEDCNNCRIVGCVEPVNVIKDLDIIQQKINALKGEKS